MHPEMIGKRPERNSRRPAEAALATGSPTRLSAQSARRESSVFWAQGARSIQKRCPLRTRGARSCARWRTTASGDGCVARGPPASGLHAHSEPPALFPPLVKLPDVPVSLSLGASAALGLPARTEFNPFLPRPRVPQRRCGLAILQLPADAAAYAPPTPSWGYRLMKRSFSSVICFVFLQSSDK